MLHWCAFIFLSPFSASEIFVSPVALIQFVVLILLVPLPLFFSSHVYTVGGFTAWVVVGVIWTFFSSFTVVIYPLWESRRALLLITTGLLRVSRSKFPLSCYVGENVLMITFYWIGFIYQRKWEVYRQAYETGRGCLISDLTVTSLANFLHVGKFFVMFSGFSRFSRS